MMGGAHRISVPLPNNPLLKIHTYLFKGERDLLIDTGADLDICEQVLAQSLQQMGVDPEKLDICITHLHTDHVGLVRRQMLASANVMCGPFDKEGDMRLFTNTILDREAIEAYMQYLGLFGSLTKLKIQDMPPGFFLDWSMLPDLKPLEEGAILKVGEHTLTCLSTPGHAPEHISLYDAANRILFSGDFLMSPMMPNVLDFKAEGSSLIKYFAALSQVESMSVDLVYAGHGDIITNPSLRIEEIIAHHNKKLVAFEQITKEGKQTVAEIASKAAWGGGSKTWEQLALVPRLFAIGETLSHLNYLVSEQRIAFIEQAGVVYFGK